MSSYTSGALLSQGTITPFHARNEVNTVPGTPVEILNITTTVTKLVSQAGVTCSVAGQWYLDVNGTVVMKGRTAPGTPDSGTSLAIQLPVTTGATIKLYFIARAGSPVTQVFGHIVAQDQA